MLGPNIKIVTYSTIDYVKHLIFSRQTNGHTVETRFLFYAEKVCLFKSFFATFNKSFEDNRSQTREFKLFISLNRLNLRLWLTETLPLWFHFSIEWIGNYSINKFIYARLMLIRHVINSHTLKGMRILLRNRQIAMEKISY